jgi:hypothetical protein
MKRLLATRPAVKRQRQVLAGRGARLAHGMSALPLTLTCQALYHRSRAFEAAIRGLFRGAIRNLGAFPVPLLRPAKSRFPENADWILQRLGSRLELMAGKAKHRAGIVMASRSVRFSWFNSTNHRCTAGHRFSIGKRKRTAAEIDQGCC